MKCFCFLLLVAMSQAYVTRDVRETKDIPTPSLTQLMTIDPPGFVVSWTPVTSLDSSDPILGYKVKVWEYGTKLVYHYVTEDGVAQLVPETVTVKVPTSDKIPEGEPAEYLIQGADNTSQRVDNVKLGVTYETRVQAYTKSGDGPLSKPMRILLGSKP